ncbi:MAG: hypothetical protein M9933_18340 [Chitinophagaceae bacterium]|nr:hypothetical protein [Chitinophagaceae bacterium]
MAWYKSDAPGAAYTHVVRLAAEFLRDMPDEPGIGLPYYYLHQSISVANDNEKPYEGAGLHNPACVFAGLTESLAVNYSIFTGDDSYVALVKKALDHMLKNGSTPADWTWGNCPYASAKGGSITYEGTSKDGICGPGDGFHVLEPDKVAEMGVAYLQFYQMTEDKTYLDAALHCADALARNVRTGDNKQSPWPFRVNAQSPDRRGMLVEEYGSNVLPAIRLFDELACIQSRIHLNTERQESYKKARDIAWDWLYSWDGPMKTYVWKGYFEDVEYDHENRNRVQVQPMEVARYLILHPEYDKFYKENVSALIQWCKSVFGTQNSLGWNAQCEQLWCMAPMGSHTARYASVCAMWYALNGGERYKEEAYETFNWATYCTSKEGFVSVGPTWKSSWFSDGYSDYIKHFFDGMAAIPEWAPAGENHLLKSTSIVQKIKYSTNKISYSTFLPTSTEVLRLVSMPKQVSIDGKVIKRDDQLKNGEGWSWEKLSSGGVLRIKHQSGRDVEIASR